MKKENTLAAKTKAIESVRSADTPESIADAHGTAVFRKRKKGGRITGDAPKKRLDRVMRSHPDAAQDRKLVKSMVKPDDLKKGAYARGGAVKGKGKTVVNVIVAGQGGAGGPPGAGGSMPPPSGPMPPPAAAAPPPRPPMMPPGGPAGAAMPPPGPMRKDGGRVSYPKMDAGAQSAAGREEKAKAYGKRSYEKAK